MRIGRSLGPPIAVARVSGSEGASPFLLLTTLILLRITSHTLMYSMWNLLIVFRRTTASLLRLQLTTQLLLTSETWSTLLDPVLEVGESVKDYAVLGDKQSHKRGLRSIGISWDFGFDTVFLVDKHVEVRPEMSCWWDRPTQQITDFSSSRVTSAYVFVRRLAILHL
jgi:hypothetical protein